mgnify:CR=1 FL=1
MYFNPLTYAIVVALYIQIILYLHMLQLLLLYEWNMSVFIS